MTELSDNAQLAKDYIAKLRDAAERMTRATESQFSQLPVSTKDIIRLNIQEAEENLSRIRSRIRTDKLSRLIDKVKDTMSDIDVKNKTSTEIESIVETLLDAGSQFGDFIDEAKNRTSSDRNFTITLEEYNEIRAAGTGAF